MKLLIANFSENINNFSSILQLLVFVSNYRLKCSIRCWTSRITTIRRRCASTLSRKNSVTSARTAPMLTAKKNCGSHMKSCQLVSAKIWKSPIQMPFASSKPRFRPCSPDLFSKRKTNKSKPRLSRLAISLRTNATNKACRFSKLCSRTTKYRHSTRFRAIKVSNSLFSPSFTTFYQPKLRRLQLVCTVSPYPHQYQQSPKLTRCSQLRWPSLACWNLVQVGLY